MNRIKQQGFTLIELMIAVVLGLLITAAVTQIYVMGVRTARTQQAAAGILDANIYGLQQIEKNLRMAGLELGKSSQLNKACSGILIEKNGVESYNCDGSKIDAKNGNDNRDIYALKVAKISNDYKTKSNFGPSNVTSHRTPQLTIQYRAPVDMRDCEGRLALGPRQAKATKHGVEDSENPIIDIPGQVVVERYFVQDNNGTLELRCDAGRYVTENINEETDIKNKSPAEDYEKAAILGKDSDVVGLGQNDALVIAGIDDFQVKFTLKSNNSFFYSDIDEFLNNKDYPEIVGLRMAVIAKGTIPIASGDAPDVNPTYIMFGEEVGINGSQPTNIVRRVYETNTMLRNSRGS